MARALAAWVVLAAGRAAGAEPAWPSEVPLGPVRPFSWERLQREAAAAAGRPYVAPPAPPGDKVAAIDFDAFGRARYRAERTLWRGQGDHGVRFFPLATTAPTPVEIAVVQGGQARAVPYSPQLFDLPTGSPVAGLGPQAGFGGFRIMNADDRTDWAAFIGAAYFRAADPFNQYGLSARGLALNAGGPGAEEFPRFSAFWLEPGPGAAFTVYARLNSPSVAGAYRIVHRRGPGGLVQDIDAQVSFRQAVARPGVAPLTTMYWYGLGDRGAESDWRPQIHDSDGLAMWTGAGERIWRPLIDPPRVMLNAFRDRAPKGFGLMQRDRTFADYQDDGAFYDRRPSCWVEPVGDWGEGSVQLLEIPTGGETFDNVVAFWTPAAPVGPGDRLDLAWRLHWGAEEPIAPGVARVTATRTGRGGPPAGPFPPGRRKFVVDFAGEGLAGLDRSSGVGPVVSLSYGQPFGAVAYPVVGRPAWRLAFDAEVKPGAALDLRAFLRRGGQALTETWLYQAF
ncbi:MAG TPA: glucan biosynthesis protein [Caulobacteraceae bacterium]|nr:glucan biosynthesis protein [Caulobacteraceae bacterium]